MCLNTPDLDWVNYRALKNLKHVFMEFYALKDLKHVFMDLIYLSNNIKSVVMDFYVFKDTAYALKDLFIICPSDYSFRVPLVCLQTCINDSTKINVGTDSNIMWL